MSKDKSKGKFWRGWLLWFGLRLLILAVIAGLVYWMWRPLTSWVNLAVTQFLEFFGWGLLLVVIFTLTFVEFVVRKPLAVLYHVNQWIGGIAFVAAAWGLMAFFPGSGILQNVTLGGKAGLSIIGSPGFFGGLIIFVLALIGAFCVAPKACASAFHGFFSWLIDRFRRDAAPRSSSVPDSVIPSPSAPRFNVDLDAPEPEPKIVTRYKPPPPPQPKPLSAKIPSSYSGGSWIWAKLKPRSEAPQASGSTENGVVQVQETPRTIPELEAAYPGIEAETALADDQVAQAPSKPEPLPAPLQEKGSLPGSKEQMKQVAQEVWKKYGESPDQVMVDGWKLPPVEILDKSPEIEFSQADNVKKAKLIEDSLASYGVEVKVVQINVGPTVTQFGLEPGWDRKLKEIKEKDRNGDVQVRTEEVTRTRVKVDRITSLSNDLALALAAPSIRIEAPVPGKPVVGIEVPNSTSATVSLRSVVESSTFQKMQAKAKLTVALGKGAGGEAVVGDLTKMPHLLIAGATGSGKTVCIHTIICGLLLYNTPNDVRFIMIDPKRVELTTYNSVPHLATPVIVDTNRALGALRALSQEMDKRYQILAAARARNIEAYNKTRSREKLPYLVLVIDELADLMMTSGEEVEHTLCRLAQLARATGIHLVVATQRPSVDVVTGLIKANFPTRISFAVTSQVDSRTILDSGGAEKLLGKGDMLYMPTEAAKPKRLQGCFLADAEIERIVYFWNNQKPESGSQLKLEDIVIPDVDQKEQPDDALLEAARKLAEDHNHISASFLQRHLRIGYPRAARIMEQLEEEMGGDMDEEEEVDEEKPEQ
jgi:DNA segregation ATPase FtsK/SpoIIIE, S-DNA-T family